MTDEHYVLTVVFEVAERKTIHYQVMIPLRGSHHFKVPIDTPAYWAIDLEYVPASEVDDDE